MENKKKLKIDTNTVINYKSSFVAGILIGIGVIINTVAPVPVVGPLLFSFGLITIIELQLQLYTGKIGFGFNINLIKVLLGNFIGIGITIGLYILSNPSFYQLLQEASINKFNKGFLQLLICGIFCGMLIHFAVKTKKPYITAMAITIFILIGAEHCVADFPYLMINLSIEHICKLFLVVIGNSIGAVLIEKAIQYE